MKSVHVLSWFTIATLCFFAMAASSPQCAQSDDQSLNPSLEPLAGPGNPCIDACNEESKARKRVLNMDHKACIDACNGEADCRDDCSEVKAALIEEINSDRDDCKALCQHEQGTGTGGQ